VTFYETAKRPPLIAKEVLKSLLGCAVEDHPIGEAETERVRPQNRIDLPVPGSIRLDAFGSVVMLAIDLHKNEMLSQDQEVDPAASDHGLKLIVNVELFQQFPELQFGGALRPHAFTLILEELGERCCHFSSKQHPRVLI